MLDQQVAAPRLATQQLDDLFESARIDLAALGCRSHRERRKRAASLFLTCGHYPIALRQAARSIAVQVKDGVSRSVYLLASVRRKAMSRSRNRPTKSVSNATTNSW